MCLFFTRYNCFLYNLINVVNIHVYLLFPIAHWTVPTVTGTHPPPLAYFSVNLLPGINRSIIFGGAVVDDTGVYRTNDVYLVTYTKDLVVSYSMSLDGTCSLCDVSVTESC